MNIHVWNEGLDPILFGPGLVNFLPFGSSSWVPYMALAHSIPEHTSDVNQCVCRAKSPGVEEAFLSVGPLVHGVLHYGVVFLQKQIRP